MHYAKALLFTFLLSFGFLTASAQDDDVIKVDSSIVRLNIGVVDQSGKPMKYLTKENFTLYENGVKQKIVNFEPVAAPFSVVMMLDMSGSTKSFRQNIQMSALRFLDALSPDDRIAVIEFYDKVNLLNDFTTSRKDVVHSISVANGRGGTNFYKALKLAMQKLSKEGNRRKAIVVLTDGVDTEMQNDDRKLLGGFNNSQPNPELLPENNEITKILNQSDALGVTIYPLALPTGDPAKLADPSPKQFAMYSAARNRLKLLADRSGGTLNTINRLEEMSRLYAEVAADLRTLYTIEYQPNDNKRDGKWREIKIEVDNAELITRTRQGYFAK